MRFEMQTTTRSFIHDRSKTREGINNSMIYPIQDGRILTQQSYFNNRLPATFDAREERKTSQMPVESDNTESDCAF